MGGGGQDGIKLGKNFPVGDADEDDVEGGTVASTVVLRVGVMLIGDPVDCTTERLGVPGVVGVVDATGESEEKAVGEVEGDAVG